MRLYIHGIGFVGRGVDAPFTRETAAAEAVPIADVAKPGLRRRFGPLAKLTYVAARKALADAAVADTASLAVVTGTALGEATVSVDLISQIHATRGRTLSPKLVPNSVHNAPAGHFTIGEGVRSPSVTVSQGWLSGEASLAAAADLIASGIAQSALVIAGDQADPDWSGRLASAGANTWAKALAKAGFQECAAAVVVGPKPAGRRLGSLKVAVERMHLSPEALLQILEKHGVRLDAQTDVRLRCGAGADVLKDTVASACGNIVGSIRVDGPGLGTAQGGGLSNLVLALREGPAVNNTLFIGFELNDLAFIYLTE
ncbi:MAG: beta-ketoacyl synthase chain length factor [Myxococcota bacterium]|nr:beta-ketoacyl synthase chain length factor [Myxococcota bacterium]